MRREDIPPPGEDRQADPGLKDIDAVGFAVSRTLCHLVWIEEHAAELVHLREAAAQRPEDELVYLLDLSKQAMVHMRRLRDLLLAGYTFDPTKKLPEGIEEQ